MENQLLKWWGEASYQERMARVRAFWGGSERFLVTVNSQQSGYRQVFEQERILELAPQNLAHQATLLGVNLPAFFADFGTISTAKFWGGTAHFDSTGGNIFIDPVAQSVDEAMAIAPRAIDDPALDAALAVRLWRAVCKALGTEELWLRTTDMQGPLNTAGLVVQQEELLMSMYTEPEKVHAFLGKVTDLLIDYVKYYRRETKNRVCGNIWPYTFYPCDLGLSFTEDMMPLLRADIYAEFAPPYLRRLSEAFGRLHIHCCGDFGRHAQTLAECGAPIAAVEFHYPFTHIEELTSLAPDTVFIPYISLDKQDDFDSITTYYEHLLTNTSPDHRYWFPWTDATDEALAFCEKHGF